MRHRGSLFLLALLSFLVAWGCDDDHFNLGPDDRGPVDRTTINLKVFDNATTVIPQIPRVSR